MRFCRGCCLKSTVASSASCVPRFGQPARAPSRFSRRTQGTRQQGLKCVASEQPAAQAPREATRTDEVHDDRVVYQVVGRLVRLVKVHTKRTSSGRACLLGARQADEARVKFCARAVSADRRCTVNRARTLHVIAHLLHAVALRVNRDEHRLHQLPRLLFCTRARAVSACDAQSRHARTCRRGR